MPDTSYQPKVYRKRGGSEIVVASGGAVTLESGGALNVASGGVVTVASGGSLILPTALRKGIIPLGLSVAREIGSNDYINTAGAGGILTKDTTPILERVNGATDKKTRLRWAAANVDEIAWDLHYPPDLDDTAPLIIYIRAAMGGASDTPLIALSFFEGLGDTNAGGNTAAVTGTVIATYSVTILAADVGAVPNGASIGLVPAAHGTDTFNLYGAWVEYQKIAT